VRLGIAGLIADLAIVDWRSIGECGFSGDFGFGARVAVDGRVNAKAKELQARLRMFLVRVSTFCESLPRSVTAQRVVPQLIDAAGSASSNYNGACRARTKKGFAAKIGVCVEEASEALEWLQSLEAVGIGSPDVREALIDEANQLTAILTASHKTATRRRS
jgi:four helix bundle protein